jgi:hypothetical protein
MSPRPHGAHVRKVCRCGWRAWPKCRHPWHFSYKPRSGQRYRFSFDAEFGGHIDSKSEAETKAAEIRAAINAGTFERTADRRARAQRDAAGGAGLTAVDAPVSIEQLGSTYFREAPQQEDRGAALGQ